MFIPSGQHADFPAPAATTLLVTTATADITYFYLLDINVKARVVTTAPLSRTGYYYHLHLKTARETTYMQPSRADSMNKSCEGSSILATCFRQVTIE